MDNEMKTCSCCTGSRTDLESIAKPNEQIQEVESSGQVKFKEKMIYLQGGEFLMGTEDNEGFPSDGEGPIRKVTVSPYYIDAYAVTNEEFSAFVKETGYITESEKFGWSFVFEKLIPDSLIDQAKQLPQTPWWYAVDEAYWYQPEGPGSSIEGRMDHPVIQVSWNDAVAFCKWASKRLPTEAEWEYAARGGLEQKLFPWGDELTPNGEHYCNIWQGEFPNLNTEEDGYLGTAPAKSFPENGYGLFNVAGNVWEWCSDWFTRTPDTSQHVNPTGPDTGQSKVMRGGSYLCHRSYCNRYRVAARSSNTIDSATGNLGFRCVVDL
ncbi:formylglycine-generating enzyme family protein [Radiobacillus deserti]|uniref:Formylglycine-generating enzyme family protein n=1 Tax=Radiobacillus deserti TaxID=2594883 RepID=A0A516KCP5_9BACI|nr:formylglycine-generating enzyme family protein [Radiobacillus deserti]QDP39183.1 formylglycine-generating enzyme family protein [Radiobacillus deserti]